MMFAVKCVLGISLLILITIVECQVFPQDAQKADHFKTRFVQYSKQCAAEYDTTVVEVMPLFVSTNEDNSKGMCYLYCMLDKYKLMNQKGKYQRQNFQQFIDSIPESRFKNSIKASTSKCVTEDAEEPCVKAYKFTKCFYKNGAALKKPPQ